MNGPALSKLAGLVFVILGLVVAPGCGKGKEGQPSGPAGRKGP
jgi:hypothetical protein